VKTFRFGRNQVLPLDLQRTFSFFADAHNLEVLTPPWLRFEVLTPAPIKLGAGALIDYKLRLRGVPVSWQSEIMVWQAPFRFVDVQRKGPYGRWVHEHRFFEIQAGTLVSDEIEYAIPGGPIINRLLVRPDLHRIFDYRSRVLKAWALDQLPGGHDQAEFAAG
jgi:ligand-binding SRPBCC domain-containing protein